MRKALAVLTAAGALAAFALPAAAGCGGMHSASAQSTPVDVASADQATTKTTQQSQASTGTSN